MNIILFGSTDLTLEVANYLYENNYKIAAIITTPQEIKISYNKNGIYNTRFKNMIEWGLQRNIKTIIFEDNLKIANELSAIDDKFAIVAGWYYMIPSKIRELFERGCAGFHASLLPQLRGGAPLNWAILLGLKETGVSFFELSDGVDNGLLYAQEKFAIGNGEYIQDLIHKTEKAILKILDECMPRIVNNTLIKFSQQGTPSYCGQRCPEDSLINWNDSADKILRLIRASAEPYSGAYSYLTNNERLYIWSADESEYDIHGIAGQIQIIDNKICISCGDKAIIATKVTNADNDNYLEKLLQFNHQRFFVNV